MLIKSRSALDLAWLFRVTKEGKLKKLPKIKSNSEMVKRLGERKVVSGPSHTITEKGQTLLRKVKQITLRHRFGVLFDQTNHFVTANQISSKVYNWATFMWNGKTIITEKGFQLQINPKKEPLSATPVLNQTAVETYQNLWALISNEDQSLPLLKPKIYQTRWLNGIGHIWLMSRSGRIAFPVQETFFWLIYQQGYKGIEFRGSGKIQNGNIIRVTALTKTGKRKLFALIAPCVPYETKPDFNKLLGGANVS